jgi:hypothetical protein
MEPVRFDDWELNSDPQATRRAFESIKTGGPEACGCCHCRNFALARERVYSPRILALFNQLGINPVLEEEVYHFNRLQPGVHLYGGWFHFVGSIQVEGKKFGPLEPSVEPFCLFFHMKPALIPKSFEGLQVCQLEFTAHVPWVLGDHPEPE